MRAADDVADDPSLTPTEKIERLDRMEAALLGDDRPDANPQAAALRRALAERGLSPEHAQDLLKAFRLDAFKRRYADWDDLMSYCALSAMPVGRFVLDVHGESPSTWPASDAICAALQIINHLQDCGADYRDLDRVYLPLDVLASHGVAVEALGEDGLPGLRRCIAELAVRAAEIAARRRWAGRRRSPTGGCGLEISVIHALAMRLTRVLAAKDPLGDETHLGKWQAGGVGLLAALRGARAGFGQPGARPPRGRGYDRDRRTGRRSGARGPPGARFTWRCGSCRRATAGDVRDLFFLPGGRRHRRQWRPARGSDRAAAALARRSRRDLCGRAAAAPARAGRRRSRTFELRREDFMAVIDGMEMDVMPTIAAPDWATLDLYCDRVASAVGRLSVRVFGMDEEPGVALAHHLGRALQLTNILRDIDEDAGVGTALSAAGGSARRRNQRRVPRRRSPIRRSKRLRAGRGARRTPFPSSRRRSSPAARARHRAHPPHHGARPIG